jgi:RHS repeat-associated protein
MREVERNTPAVSLPVLVTTTTRIGSDGSNNDTTATATFRSLFDGRQVAEEDAQHVKRSIAYDGLGRLIRETASADSAFAVSETRAYTLAYEGSWMEATDATGQRTRVEQDGFGREVSHVAVNWKGDGLNHEIWRASFDVLGRMVSDIHTDVDVPVVGSTSSVLVLQTQYRYDGWDNCIATIHPSGVQSVALVDPVRRVTDEYDEVIDGGMVRQSGHIRTTTSISNKPLLVERIDSQGAQVDTKYEYDSLDRCIAETNAAGHLTRHVYDACDRLSQTTLPDSAIVLRTYARHSDEAWLESIVVHHTSLPGKGVVLGKQTFDGLGRRTLLRAGQRETRYAYEEGATLPFETTLPSGEVVASRYEKYLGERLVELTTSSQPDRDKVAFEHDKKRGWLLRATNALGSQSMDYLSSGRLAKATFSYDDQVQVAIYSGYTLKGQLTRFAGVDGVERRLQFNSLGRLQRLENGALVTELEYDAFGRRSRVSTWTIDESRATVMTMEYDEHGRESRRVVTCESAHMALGQAMTHTYSATGHLEARTCVTETGAREERYDYDVRGRLIEYRCKGLNGPVDASGRAISYQRFTLDALDNIRKFVTRFIDPLEPEKVSTFHYARQDPTQLVKLVEKQVGRPDLMLAFAYDPSGNLLRDEDGRQLEYDAIGRLIGWSAGPSQRTYRYDPLDRIGCVEDDGHRRYRYYDGDNVTYETGEASSSSYHCVEGSMLAHTKAGGVVLLGRDAQGSVIGEASAEPRQAAYTAYGHRAEGSGDSDIGFAGELMDHTTGWYLLGSYRAYNPRLMRFHSPDAASPFGAGDFNAYAYCGCNPTERVDPTGQEWWEALGLIAFGLIAFGLTVTAPGVGLSVALTLGINTEAAVAATAAGTIAAASDVYATASVAASTVALAFDITSVAAEETGWEEGAQGFALAGMAIGAFSAGWARKAGLLKARETVGQVAGTARGAVGRGASAIGRGAGTLIRKARAADRAAAGINRSIASTAGPRLRPRPSPSAGSPDSVAQAGRSTENAVTEMAPPPLQRLARNRNGLRRRPTDVSAGNASSQPSPLTRHQGGVPDSPMTAGRQSLTASPIGDVERILSRFMETAV